MKKIITIIGMGRFGLSLLEAVAQNKAVTIIAIDKDEKLVNKASKFTPFAYICDSTNEASLNECKVDDSNLVVVALGQGSSASFTASILTTIKLKNMELKRIIVRVDDLAEYGEVFKSIGATEVISPTKIASDKFSNSVLYDNLVDYFRIAENFDAFEIKLDYNFKELPIIELSARSKFFMNILLIKRNGEAVLPTRETSLKPRDTVILFGKIKDIEKISSFFKSNSDSMI